MFLFAYLFAVFVVIRVIFECALIAAYQWLLLRRKPSIGRRKHAGYMIVPQVGCYISIPKPPWVREEIIRLKALMPDAGCRKIAATFNRCYSQGKGMTVSKSYVCNVVRKHLYEIQVLRQKIKHKRPRAVPKNLIWGMDLTGKTDSTKQTHTILGIIEHHSRANLCLKALTDKSSATLLRCLLDCVERYGKPKCVRTDNEPVFTSKLFRLGLLVLGIRHQKTDLHCPWQNGRVERFFGTLKDRLNLWEVDSIDQLNLALIQFRFWFNHIRPHQYLDDRTPAEVWSGDNIFQGKPRKAYWFEAWDGLLAGYYFPP